MSNIKLQLVTNSIRAKGGAVFFQRLRNITQRYGMTLNAMEHSLQQFTEVLGKFDCKATFPITAVTLHRHARTIAEYRLPNIEYSVHGYTHIPYSSMNREALISHLHLAQDIFNNAGFDPHGFRSPYLNRSNLLHEVAGELGFTYTSNQPHLWDVIDQDKISPQAKVNLEHAVTYYEPWRSEWRPSIPRIINNIVELPVSLPDDEILIERLHMSGELILDTWVRMLKQSYQRGELMTLQLHPERIALCAECLEGLLSEAHALSPMVWCASLFEISLWWKTLNSVVVKFSSSQDDRYSFDIEAPDNVTVLARGVEVQDASKPFSNGYVEIKSKKFSVASKKRPVIGISPLAPESLRKFLRDQGYIIELSLDGSPYSCYFDSEQFESSQENSVLECIEGKVSPLVKLGRWPNAAQSALAITGDIDALTLWDYGLRLFGK
jgi:hypothetical protein